MLSILLRWLLNALILYIIPSIVPNFFVGDFWSALIAILVLGIINALIKPILILLTLPVNILTLGGFTLIINGFIFWLTSTIVKGFIVDGFWTAFWAALVFSIISIFINWLDKAITTEDK
jgi:putative membrane protein